MLPVLALLRREAAKASSWALVGGGLSLTICFRFMGLKVGTPRESRFARGLWLGRLE